jgi:hypothetical protein
MYTAQIGGETQLLMCSNPVLSARASATRSKGKQPKPRHSRRSQTKVKKRSQQRPVDDEISDIIEQIQAEVPIAIVGNKAITFESEAGINQTTEAVDIVCNNAATENINIDATEAGGQERVDRQTCEFEPLIPVVKQPDIKPDEKFIPTLQHVYDCHGERDINCGYVVTKSRDYKNAALQLGFT